MVRKTQTVTPFVNTGNPGFPEPWLSEIRRRTGNNPRNSWFFIVFFRFFRRRILENYPRRSSAFFWTGLELRRPKFDRFRSTVRFFSAFWPQKVWKSNFSPLFLKEQALKPCSDCRSPDLLHGKKNKRNKLDFHTCWVRKAEQKRNSETPSVELWSPEL